MPVLMRVHIQIQNIPIKMFKPNLQQHENHMQVIIA